MTTIQDREYVEKKEGRFHPTGLGKTVNDVLIDGGFADLFNVTYTARMEEELDEIEEGKLKWTDALTEFYDKFKLDLAKFQKFAKDIKEKETPTDEVCLKCNTPAWCRSSAASANISSALTAARRAMQNRSRVQMEPRRKHQATVKKNLKLASCVASRCS